MGLGGDLMWTIFTKNYYFHIKEKPVLYKIPKFSDIVTGRIYDRNFSYRESLILKSDKYYETNEFKRKTKIIYFIDSIFEIIKNKYFKRQYQEFIFKIARRKNKNIVYTNYYKNSYFFDYYKNDNKINMMWSINYPFAEYLCNNYSVNYKFKLPELKFYENEIEIYKSKINKLNLNKYIVINTDSKEDYFNKIRMWPENNWLKLINFIKKQYPDLNIVELNLKNPIGGKQVIPIRKLLSFRECGLLIKDSKLFIGTDGGLTHLSAAVRKKGIIIWSSLINDEITGYPDFHTIIKNKNECSNFGHFEWCEKCTKSMSEISNNDVNQLVSKCLDEL